MPKVERLDWMRRAQNKPVDAQPPTFEDFFRSEQERLHRALSVICGNRGEAEELAQEAFTRVLERWDQVSVMGSPTGYLYRTAMNLLRSQRRRVVVALKNALGPSEEDVFGPVDDRDVVRHALAALTARQRAALVLTEGLGYSNDEAGRLLGIAASTVGALRHQARVNFRATEEVADA